MALRQLQGLFSFQTNESEKWVKNCQKKVGLTILHKVKILRSILQKGQSNKQIH
jgi:hypothetical protein